MDNICFSIQSIPKDNRTPSLYIREIPRLNESFQAQSQVGMFRSQYIHSSSPVRKPLLHQSPLRWKILTKAYVVTSGGKCLIDFRWLDSFVPLSEGITWNYHDGWIFDQFGSTRMVADSMDVLGLARFRADSFEAQPNMGIRPYVRSSLLVSDWHLSNLLLVIALEHSDRLSATFLRPLESWASITGLHLLERRCFESEPHWQSQIFVGVIAPH